jgi:hypothetical protein
MVLLELVTARPLTVKAALAAFCVLSAAVSP